MMFSTNTILPDQTGIPFLKRRADLNAHRWIQVKASLGKADTYNASLHLGESDISPDDAIRNPEGRSEQQAVTVECVVGARLLASGRDIEVENEEWVYRRFTDEGTADWAWAVTAHVPQDQELTLEFRPAVIGGDVDMPVDADATITRVTTVQVESTMVESADHWFKSQWPLVSGVAVVVGGALIAFIAWLSLGRERMLDLIGKSSRDKGTARSDEDTRT